MWSEADIPLGGNTVTRERIRNEGTSAGHKVYPQSLTKGTYSSLLTHLETRSLGIQVRSGLERGGSPN